MIIELGKVTAETKQGGTPLHADNPGFIGEFM